MVKTHPATTKNKNTYSITRTPGKSLMLISDDSAISALEQLSRTYNLLRADPKADTHIHTHMNITM